MYMCCVFACGRTHVCMYAYACVCVPHLFQVTGPCCGYACVCAFAYTCMLVCTCGCMHLCVWACVCLPHLVPSDRVGEGPCRDVMPAAVFGLLHSCILAGSSTVPPGSATVLAGTVTPCGLAAVLATINTAVRCGILHRTLCRRSRRTGQRSGLRYAYTSYHSCHSRPRR